MINRDLKNKYTFEFNDHGVSEVSEQILNSYNSGFIGEGTALTDSKDYAEAEE
jgi:hypothetical protein